MMAEIAPSSLAAWASALVALLNASVLALLLLYTKRQLDHMVDKAFLDRIKDENFKFDDNPTLGPEAGEYVRLWIFRQASPINYGDFKRFPTAKRNALLHVLMAHDRVVHDFDFGLSKKTVMEYQAPEFALIWRNCEEVVKGVRKDKLGLDTFCFHLGNFVTSPEFRQGLEDYRKNLPSIDCAV